MGKKPWHMRINCKKWECLTWKRLKEDITTVSSLKYLEDCHVEQELDLFSLAPQVDIERWLISTQGKGELQAKVGWAALGTADFSLSRGLLEKAG